MTRPTLAILLLLTLPAMLAAQAQRSERILKGVVWDQPDDIIMAETDLYRMYQMGVQAVRTTPVDRDAIFEMADTLNIQLFQELPVVLRTGVHLEVQFEKLSNRLRSMIIRSRGHGSARHYGISVLSDTSDPATCELLARLSDQIRDQAPVGTSSYLVTPFTELEQCSSEVDVALLYLPVGGDLEHKVEKWLRLQEGRFGIANLSHSVRPSPERQARYLEDNLGYLISQPVFPYAVFVSSWRDQAQAAGSDSLKSSLLIEDRTGLHSETGDIRLAAEVVAGVFTGEKLVFAIDMTEETDSGTGTHSVILGVWGIIAVLGLLCLLSPAFLSDARRYFVSHGFYQEVLREGRQVNPFSSAVLLLALVACFGLVVLALVMSLSDTLFLDGLVKLLRQKNNALVENLIQRPWTLMALMASVYAITISLWCLVTTLLAGLSRPLSLGQSLNLVLWPRWLYFVLLPVAGVMITLPAPLRLKVAFGLFVAILVIEFIAIVGSLLDLTKSMRISALKTFGLGLLLPIIAAVVAAQTALGPGARSYLSFLWSLAKES